MRLLPTVTAPGAAQMAIDEGLLNEAVFVTARRYVWQPAALSLGKFQRAPEAGGDRRLPFDLVRRPSGGRAVLHGAGFEWSFAVVFPSGTLPGDRVDDAYGVVSAALAEALGAAGVHLDEGSERSYQHSALCFAGGLRHDLMVGAHKVAAVAQVRRNGRVLVHGSVLERRPPAHLIDAAEALLGEPWQSDGLGVTGASLDAEAVWQAIGESLVQRLARRSPVVAVG